MQAIIGAAATGDFAAIEQSSARIGYSEQMAQMCSHMGAGAPGFTEHALAFHHTVDKIGEAARQRDLTGVLASLSATLTACTACHAAFKHQVVTERSVGTDGHQRRLVSIRDFTVRTARTNPRSSYRPPPRQ